MGGKTRFHIFHDRRAVSVKKLHNVQKAPVEL